MKGPGRTGYERYLLGSVAEKVVRIAPVPVLTVAIGDVDETIADIRAGIRSEPAANRAETETPTEPQDQLDDTALRTDSIQMHQPHPKNAS